MALLHNQFCPCSKSETDLFKHTTDPERHLGGGSQFHEYKPLNAVTTDGPLEFSQEHERSQSTTFLEHKHF